MQTLLWMALPITSRKIAQRDHRLTEKSIKLVHSMLSAAPWMHKLISLQEIMNAFPPDQEVYYER